MPTPPTLVSARGEAFDETVASSPELAQKVQASLHTQSPLTRPGDASTGTHAARGGRALALVGAIVLAAGIAGVGLLLRQRAAVSPASAPPVNAASPPAVATTFTMVIDSAPPGAEVRENDQLLGTTPIQVAIAREGVRSSPRRFVVRLDGYAPYTLVQGDAEGIVHIVAPLSPAPASASAASPAPPASSAASRPASPHPTTAPHPASPATPSTHQDLDIKLTR
jgi:serine/threonine-protein kinase